MSRILDLLTFASIFCHMDVNHAVIVGHKIV